MKIDCTDNSEKFIEAMQEAAARALEECGLVAEGYAKKLCAVDTGNLRNSISHKVDEGEPAVYIGTNVEYAPYLEFGTGKYSELGGGSPPWVYRDDEGKYHYTEGNKAKPFIKPAIADHAKTYRQIINKEMKNG